MKKFILKVLYLFVSFSLLTLLMYFSSMLIKSKVSIEIINKESIEAAQILILGDSRADRQINPNSLNKLTKKKCLNIGESSLDLYSLSLRLQKIKLENKILIISASSFQTNDGSIDQGYFRIEAYNALTFQQKLDLYIGNPNELKKILSKNILSGFKIKLTLGNENSYINDGYTNISCKNFLTTDFIKNHPWYKKNNRSGVKNILLERALISLNKIKCRQIIIYNAPIYKEFKNLAVVNGFWEYENDFSKQIKKCLKIYNLKKIRFYDLTNLDGFDKSDFYDPHHLCEKGANKFTERIHLIFNLNSLSF